MRRLIPCLLLKNGGLVKTVKFTKPRYVGDPINAIRIFNDKEVDELMLLDITASKEGRSPNVAVVEQCASECFMPLCYGGGVQSENDAEALFQVGVEKVSIQSAAFDNLRVIEQIAKKAGSQSVVASVDVKKTWRGTMGLYSSKSGKVLRTDWLQFLKDAVNAGAGEVVLNSVDRDGTMAGPDLDLINRGSMAVDVPVIAIGGIGNLSDVRAAISAGASAVAAGSFFVFHGPHRAVLVTYPHPNELDDLFGRQL
jgi:imidazole glycerol-phosphate synthase subunit HisF